VQQHVENRGTSSQHSKPPQPTQAGDNCNKHTHLFCKVVHADGVLRRDEEKWFGWVESHTCNAAAVLAKGVLCCVLGELVHKHRLRVAAAGRLGPLVCVCRIAGRGGGES
jgi:hypothetical protein